MVETLNTAFDQEEKIAHAATLTTDATKNSDVKITSPSKAKENAFRQDTYRTPMEKWFEPIRHFGINYILNSAISIALVAEATHGSLKHGKDNGGLFKYGYEDLQNGLGNLVKKVGLPKRIGLFWADVMTVMIPGHLLAPVIGWMHNNQSKITRWLDDTRDTLTGHKVDDAERELREGAYARLEAKPKQTAKGTITDRLAGMVANLVIQAGLEKAVSVYSEKKYKSGLAAAGNDAVKISELENKYTRWTDGDDGQPKREFVGMKEILRIPGKKTHELLHPGTDVTDASVRSFASTRAIGWAANVLLELTSCMYTAVGTWVSGKVRHRFGFGESKMEAAAAKGETYSSNRDEAVRDLKQDTDKHKNADAKEEALVEGKDGKRHAERFQPQATHLASAKASRETVAPGIGY